MASMALIETADSVARMRQQRALGSVGPLMRARNGRADPTGPGTEV